MLFQNGINYNDTPSWQKRGIGLYYELVVKDSVNPIINKEVQVNRRILKCDLDLPMNLDYSALLKEKILVN